MKRLKKICIGLLIIIALLVLANYIRYEFFYKPHLKKLIANVVKSRKQFLFDIKNYDLSRLLAGEYMYFDIDYKPNLFKNKPEDKRWGYLCLDPYDFYNEQPDVKKCKAYLRDFYQQDAFDIFLTKYEKRYSTKLSELKKVQLNKLIQEGKINSARVIVEVSSWKAIQESIKANGTKIDEPSSDNFYDFPTVVGLMINGQQY